MATSPIHTAGIYLEQLVGRLGAPLKGQDVVNSADYYDYLEGIFDGVASCLESIQLATEIPQLMPRDPGEPGARYAVNVKSAIQELRAIQPLVEDPDRFPHTVSALVHTLGALEALVQYVLERRLASGESPALTDPRA